MQSQQIIERLVFDSKLVGTIERAPLKDASGTATSGLCERGRCDQCVTYKQRNYHERDDKRHRDQLPRSGCARHEKEIEIARCNASACQFEFSLSHWIPSFLCQGLIPLPDLRVVDQFSL